jgi:hypothetical protein
MQYHTASSLLLGRDACYLDNKGNFTVTLHCFRLEVKFLYNRLRPETDKFL